MRGFRVRAGSVLGYSHRLKSINNQDWYTVGEVTIHDKEYIFGAVLDGCTGKKGSKTEVGSILLSDFIGSEIPFILSANTPLVNLPGILYQRCLGYLGSIARSTVMGLPEVMWNFIEKRLLCTIVGFVMNRKSLVTFSAGDGMIIFNDKVHTIDQDNKPLYPAYHLVDRSILGDAVDTLVNNFVVSFECVDGLKRFAVCTDGLTSEWKKDPHIIEKAWSYEPQAKAGLQWCLNKESSDNGRFSDDCTIVAVEYVGEEGEKTC